MILLRVATETLASDLRLIRPTLLLIGPSLAQFFGVALTHRHPTQIRILVDQNIIDLHGPLHNRLLDHLEALQTLAVAPSSQPNIDSGIRAHQTQPERRVDMTLAERLLLTKPHLFVEPGDLHGLQKDCFIRHKKSGGCRRRYIWIAGISRHLKTA